MLVLLVGRELLRLNLVNGSTNPRSQPTHLYNGDTQCQNLKQGLEELSNLNLCHNIYIL